MLGEREVTDAQASARLLQGKEADSRGEAWQALQSPLTHRSLVTLEVTL